MSADLELIWEWPADRKPDNQFIVVVESLRSPGGGFFGFNKSPSLVANIPDPVNLQGQVVSGEPALVGRKVLLTLPKVEIGEVRDADFVAMGVLNEGVCICIKKVSSADEKLDDWNCKSE